MASDRAKDAVVEIATILDPVIVLFQDDPEVVYGKLDELAEYIDTLIGDADAEVVSEAPANS